MDNKELIIRLNEVKRYIKHKDDIIAVEIAIAYIKIWDKFYKDIEQLRDEQAENLKGFNGTYRDGYRDALDVILLSMETRKEGIEKCKEKKEKEL